MPAADSIDVVLITDVIHVHPEIEMFAQRDGHHQIGDPVAIDNACVDVVPVTSRDIARPAAEEEPIETIRAPKIE